MEPLHRAARHACLKYELYFSDRRGNKETKIGEIIAESLTHRTSGQESPGTGAHFALYAHGACFMPCGDAGDFTFAEWEAV